MSLSINPPEGISHVQAGKFKIIALFAEKRLEMSPDVPMVKKQGIDLAMGMWCGLAVPAATPPEVIKKLHDSVKQGMDDPALRKNVDDTAVNLHWLGPEFFGKLMASDHEPYGKLVKEIKK